MGKGNCHRSNHQTVYKSLFSSVLTLSLKIKNTNPGAEKKSQSSFILKILTSRQPWKVKACICRLPSGRGCISAASPRLGLSRYDTWIPGTIRVNTVPPVAWHWRQAAVIIFNLTWSRQHFQGFLNVRRLGMCVWCSVTYSALICVYCSSYLSCVAAFSLPDIDIHCRSCAAPWAMWINTANTTPLKHHNPFCFGGSSFHCKWESLSASTHTHAHTHSSLCSLSLSKALIYL